MLFFVYFFLSIFFFYSGADLTTNPVELPVRAADVAIFHKRAFEFRQDDGGALYNLLFLHAAGCSLCSHPCMAGQDHPSPGGRHPRRVGPGDPSYSQHPIQIAARPTPVFPTAALHTPTGLRIHLPTTKYSQACNVDSSHFVIIQLAVCTKQSIAQVQQMLGEV